MLYIANIKQHDLKCAVACILVMSHTANHTCLDA